MNTMIVATFANDSQYSASPNERTEYALLAISVTSMNSAPPQIGSHGRKSWRIAPSRIASTVIVIIDLNQYSQPTAKPAHSPR